MPEPTAPTWHNLPLTDTPIHAANLDAVSSYARDVAAYFAATGSSTTMDAVGNFGATYTEVVDARSTKWMVGTLTANLALTLSMGAPSQLHAVFNQDATGGRTVTAFMGSDSHSIDVPTSPGATTQVDFFYSGTDVYVIYPGTGAGTGGGGGGGGTGATLVMMTAVLNGNAVIFTGTKRRYVSSQEAGSILAVWNEADTAPVNGPIVTDVNLNGASIFPTSKPTLAVGQHVSPTLLPSTLSVAAGDYFTRDMDRAGSTSPTSQDTSGADIKTRILIQVGG